MTLSHKSHRIFQAFGSLAVLLMTVSCSPTIETSTETVESAPLNTAQTPTATVDGDGQPQSEIDAQYIADDPDAQREEAKQCATWQDFVA